MKNTTENIFKEWMKTQKSRRGNLYDKKTIQSYSKRLTEFIPLYYAKENLEYSSVFECNDLTKAEELFKKLKNFSDYDTNNKKLKGSGNGTFNAAFECYLNFLREQQKNQQIFATHEKTLFCMDLQEQGKHIIQK